eukprot:COSAG01_NODE_4607_length_4883_cov_93.522993_4_plen_82_part_00
MFVILVVYPPVIKIVEGDGVVVSPFSPPHLPHRSENVRLGQRPPRMQALKQPAQLDRIQRPLIASAACEPTTTNTEHVRAG